MRRIRSNLTYANVVATLSLFLVLGGGTALASYIVSSNSQVGPGTISGHKPPTGKHANLITGSVNGQDVADNSLRGTDIAESSLDPSVLQLRVDGSCSAGSAISSIAGDGTVSCESVGDTASQILSKLTTVDGTGSALDADFLDGASLNDLKLSCPSGYVRINALCWEDVDASNMTFEQASDYCRTQGGRLPSWDEMSGAMQSGVTLGNGGVLFDRLADADTTTTDLVMNSNTDSKNVTSVALTGQAFARCVVEPTPAIGYAP
jgi:hypothetical protein